MQDLDERFEQRMRAAGQTTDDPAVRSALDDLVLNRTEAGAPKSRRRLVTVSVGVSLALLVGSGAAVAATEWGPWNYVPEPDWVLAREWVDTNGTWIGSCESHTALDSYPEEVEQALRAYLTSLDTEELAPDTEWAAIDLKSVGRLDELNRLIPGADPNDFDLEGVEAGSLPEELVPVYSDARILQNALEMAAFKQVGAALRADSQDFLIAQFGGADYVPLASHTQTQCTTDPVRAVQETE